MHDDFRRPHNDYRRPRDHHRRDDDIIVMFIMRVTAAPSHNATGVGEQGENAGEQEYFFHV